MSSGASNSGCWAEKSVQIACVAGLLRSSAAFCPGGISSFFEVCRTDKAGNLLTDPTKIGSRGGGFVITRGATSRVTVRKRRRTRVEVRINSRPAPEAQTTRSALEQLINANSSPLDVLAEVHVGIPIAAGFGTSAAGTLASCLALVDAAELPVTFNDVGRVAHVAEVLHSTGLGTASALLYGGFVLVREPGAPGTGVIDRLRFPAGHSIVCAYLGPIQTRDALAKQSEHATYALAARSAFEAINKNPTLPVFLHESRKFGKEAGFETPRVIRVISAMMSGGAIGAAQNMIGEAAHGVVEDSKATELMSIVKRASPHAMVFTSRLDNRGVRLLKPNEKH